MKENLIDWFSPTKKADFYDRMKTSARWRQVLYVTRINQKQKWRRNFETGAERVLKSYFGTAHTKLAPDENSGF